MARFIKDRKKSHGKIPGSVIFLGNQKIETSQVRVIRYSKTDFEEYHLSDISDISRHLSDDFITWINIDGLHDTYLIENLGEQLKIPSLILKNIVNTDNRPYYTEDEDYLAVSIKTFFYEKEITSLQSEQISFLLNKNLLITFQEKPGDAFDPIRERIRKSRGRIRQSGADYLYFTLIDILFDEYYILLEQIGSKTEALDNQILNNFSKSVINDIYQLMGDLNFLHKSCLPLKDLMMKISHSDSPYINRKTMQFLRDMEDLSNQINDIISSYRTLLNDQLNIYNSTLNQKSNEVVKVLTIFATIFIPLTFIASIYGMNFRFMPELSFKYSYPLIWLLMIATTVVMLIYFRRKKWL